MNNNDNKVVDTGFWTGPYGILVPNHIERIKASDGGNTLYKSGGSTEMNIPNPLTEEEYKNKYCRSGTDGEYYWVGANSHGYWK